MFSLWAATWPIFLHMSLNLPVLTCMETHRYPEHYIKYPYRGFFHLNWIGQFCFTFFKFEFISLWPLRNHLLLHFDGHLKLVSIKCFSIKSNQVFFKKNPCQSHGPYQSPEYYLTLWWFCKITLHLNMHTLMCIYQMDTGMFNGYVSITKQYIGYCTIPKYSWDIVGVSWKRNAIGILMLVKSFSTSNQDFLT